MDNEFTPLTIIDKEDELPEIVGDVIIDIDDEDGGEDEEDDLK